MIARIIALVSVALLAYSVGRLQGEMSIITERNALPFRIHLPANHSYHVKNNDVFVTLQTNQP